MALKWILPASVVATAAVIWGGSPLGVPGEWTWDRLPAIEADWFSIAAAAAGYLLVVYLGGRRFDQAARRERGLWLALLVSAGFGWLWILQEAVPSPVHRLSKAGFVLFYPGPSGYFTTARKTDARRREFLSNYAEFVAKGDVLHAGTHPPGLIVAYWLLFDLTRLPRVSDALNAAQPESVRQTFDNIEHNSLRSDAPLTRHDRAALWLALLLVQLVAAGTCIPLYGLVRRLSSDGIAWWTTSLWPAVPALAVFIPKSDVLLAFFGTAFLWIWLASRDHPRPVVRLAGAALSGTVYWLGLCISLAMLPVAVVAVSITLWEAMTTNGADRSAAIRRAWQGAVLAAVAFAAWCLVVRWQASLNLPAVWLENYRNHARFYEQFPRTWWKWLCVNPVELSLALGTPAMCLAVSGLCTLRQASPRQRGALCGLAVWLLLWLSGKNSGETARLWIFLMPWWCAMAPLAIEHLQRTQSPAQSRTWLLTAVGCQLLCAAIVATGAAGFHVPPF